VAGSVFALSWPAYNLAYPKTYFEEGVMTLRPLCLTPLLVLTTGVFHAQDARSKVIDGVTLIDGTGRGPVQDAVIVIEGARISQVGPRHAVTAAPGAAVIDGQGRFVIPGLADMHHHLLSGSTFPRPNRQTHLRRMLAVGVTTVFNPSLNLKDVALLKGVAADDASPFPRFFSTGPMVSVKGDVMASFEGGASPGHSGGRSAVRYSKRGENLSHAQGRRPLRTR
jgi:hypothetical protein